MRAACGMMRKMMVAAVYTALAFGANAASADVAALLTGDMKKLALHAPAPVPDAVLLDGGDAEVPLANWRGQWVVLNFWATWCAPCRAEMPSLQRLQAAMPGLAVLPVAAGRNPMPAIRRFYDEAAITLPVLRDPKSVLAHQMGVLGLPVTLIIDPQGREVARLIGDAEWDSAAAQAVLAALMAGG